MKSSDKIKSMQEQEQLEILQDLVQSHGDVDCINCANGEYWRVDSYKEDGIYHITMMCYDCQDILLIEIDMRTGYIISLENSMPASSTNNSKKKK